MYMYMYVYVYVYVCIYIYTHIRLRGGNGRSQNRCFLRVHDKGMGTSLCCPTRAMVVMGVLKTDSF